MVKFDVNTIIDANKSFIPENSDMQIIRKIVSANPNIFERYDAKKILSKLYKEIVVSDIASVFRNNKYNISTGTYEFSLGKRNIFKYSEFGDELGRITYGVFANGQRIAEFNNSNTASTIVTKINDIANNYSTICWL